MSDTVSVLECNVRGGATARDLQVLVQAMREAGYTVEEDLHVSTIEVTKDDY